MNDSDIDADAVARARHARAIIAPLAAEIEAARRLPATVVQALIDAGAFKLALPAALGGHDASLATLMAVYEELARADGSAGWCAMIGGTSAMMSGFMSERLAAEVYGPADAITCGVFAPMGRAVRTDGGWRVSGRWPFASGCEHAEWRMGGALVLDGDQPELLPSGAPHARSFMFRAGETSIVDTWTVSGLRGTGSHDLVVKDLLVPDDRCFSLVVDKPRFTTELYQLPVFGVLATGVASVALGIARAAIDFFVGVARSKQPVGARRTIAHRELVQLDVARAEARLAAARAYLFGAAADATRAHRRGDASLAERAALRLAACHAASEAAVVVDAMYNAAGASSIYATNPLQRCFRDVHVATQHAMIGREVQTLVGRVLLGVESDLSLL